MTFVSEMDAADSLLSILSRLETLELKIEWNMYRPPVEGILLTLPTGASSLRSSSLRSLSIKGLAVDLQGLQPSRITSLSPWSHPTFNLLLRGYPLTSSTVAAIARLGSLRKLSLANWRTWDDLAPLNVFPLKESECKDVALLENLLFPGALQSLKAVSLGGRL